MAIAAQFSRLHIEGLVHGQLTAGDILVDSMDRVLVTYDRTDSGPAQTDLTPLGRIFAEMLTGRLLSPEQAAPATNEILHSEARLVVEKLVGAHSSGPFVNADELYTTLQAMSVELGNPQAHAQQAEHIGSARLYLILSAITLFLLLTILFLSWWYR